MTYEVEHQGSYPDFAASIIKDSSGVAVLVTSLPSEREYVWDVTIEYQSRVPHSGRILSPQTFANHNRDEEALEVKVAEISMRVPTEHLRVVQEVLAALEGATPLRRE